jgi:hypothetical protein
MYQSPRPDNAIVLAMSDVHGPSIRIADFGFAHLMRAGDVLLATSGQRHLELQRVARCLGV